MALETCNSVLQLELTSKVKIEDFQMKPSVFNFLVGLSPDEVDGLNIEIVLKSLSLLVKFSLKPCQD